MIEYSFPKYLLSKQTVDDRALNAGVYKALRLALPGERPLRVVEVGAGIGSMLKRLLTWEVLEQAEYFAVDESAENIAYGRTWLPQWSQELGWQMEEIQEGARLSAGERQVYARLVATDVFDYIRTQPAPADLLIAHAFLDLLPLPASLRPLLGLLKPGGLGWLTLNFDGATIFEPAIDPAFDTLVEALYHRSMDERLTTGVPSGDSRTGRHLFAALQGAGAEILEAGPSDWVVFPRQNSYPAQEAYFLHFILHFFETALGGHPALDRGRFTAWLEQRHAQVERGEMVYIAHQLDFLVRMK